jgi:hypothetical protein
MGNLGYDVKTNFLKFLKFKILLISAQLNLEQAIIPKVAQFSGKTKNSEWRTSTA